MAPSALSGREAACGGRVRRRKRDQSYRLRKGLPQGPAVVPVGAPPEPSDMLVVRVAESIGLMRRAAIIAVDRRRLASLIARASTKLS